MSGLIARVDLEGNKWKLGNKHTRKGNKRGEDEIKSGSFDEADTNSIGEQSEEAIASARVARARLQSRKYKRSHDFLFHGIHCFLSPRRGTIVQGGVHKRRLLRPDARSFVRYCCARETARRKRNHGQTAKKIAKTLFPFSTADHG